MSYIRRTIEESAEGEAELSIVEAQRSAAGIFPMLRVADDTLSASSKK